jgi:hypothetical protein
MGLQQENHLQAKIIFKQQEELLMPRWFLVDGGTSGELLVE